MSLELGPLADDAAPLVVRTDTASVTTTMQWPGERVLAGWELLAAGRAPAESGLAIGVELFDAAFADPHALRLFHDAAARADFLRLRIRTSDPTLASLPWELLADPTWGEFLGRSGSITRWLDLPDAVPVHPDRGLEAPGPVRALVVGVSPLDRPLPHLERELDAIRAVYEEAVDDGVAREPTVLLDATRRDVADALRVATESGEPYDIVHLSCHAGVPTEGDEPVLVLAADDNDSGEVSPEALARLFADDPPRLIVLNACGSMAADGRRTHVVQQGFTRALLKRGVPAVVGMQEEVDDAFAAAVGGDLHQSLLDGRSVDAAVTDVRRLVEDGTTVGASHFGIPVVYLAPGHERLVPPPAPPVAEGHAVHPVVAWLQAHRPVGTGVAAALVLLAVAGLGGWLGGWFAAAEPPVMSGDFNIALADFGLGPAVDPDLATLDTSLATELDDQICGDTPVLDNGDVQFECLGPVGVPTVGGATDADRVAAAADLAAAMNANVLVHGALSADGDDVTFRSWLHVTDADLARAPELVGSHELTDIDARLVSDNDRRAFRREVRDATRGLAQLVVALGAYSAGEWAEALAVVEGIDRDSFPLGSDLVSLLEGNLHGRLGDVDAAAAVYRELRDRDPGDPGAALGLAEVAFHEGVGGGTCRPGTVDEDQLTEAAGLYRQVADAIDDGPATFGTSATFGLARLDLCRWLAGLGEARDDARRGFEEVVAAYEDDPGQLVDTTAESHSGLALLATLTARESGDDADWEAVVRHADAALDLRPAGADRRSHFLQQRALAEHALGSGDEACASLGAAADGATERQLAQIERSRQEWSC